MAINQNHLFEELNGIKCGIVEKNVKPERVQFLKDLLEINHFIVVAVPSPPPKIAPSPAAATSAQASPAVVPSPQTTDTLPVSQEQILPLQPAPPETFTVGVTDITFNPINAIFGRLLQTRDGHVVTLAYWQQRESVAHDEIPYFDDK